MRNDSRRFRLVLCATIVGTVAVCVHAEGADQVPQKVKVFAYARTDASGFTDNGQQELEATVKDIREAIVKKKNSSVELVEAREQAVIVIEVTDRQLVERQGQVAINTTYSKDGKRASSTATQTKEHDVVLKATMRVGDYTKELTGECDLGYLFGGAYRQAAKNMVGSLENWIKNNYTRLQVK
jgi:hypothetical protein